MQAGYQSLRQIRVAMGSRDAERNKVAKSVRHASRKAAIVYTVPAVSYTHLDVYKRQGIQSGSGHSEKCTGNIETGEKPKAGGRSIVKELGKMTP